MQIVPAPLVYTEEELEEQLTKLIPYFDYLAIDIADGELIEEKTIQFDQVISTLKRMASVIEKELIVDLDLMVKDYQKIVQRLPDLPSFVKPNVILLRPGLISKEQLEKLNNSGQKFGIALHPEVSVETIQQQFELNSISTIQILTIDPGAQGRPFMPEQLEKIEQLRNAGYRNKIFLDGGINDKTLPIILSKNFRPDVLCIGSYFSQADILKERIEKIHSLLL